MAMWQCVCVPPWCRPMFSIPKMFQQTEKTAGRWTTSEPWLGWICSTCCQSKNVDISSWRCCSFPPATNHPIFWGEAPNTRSKINWAVFKTLCRPLLLENGSLVDSKTSPQVFLKWWVVHPQLIIIIILINRGHPTNHHRIPWNHHEHSTFGDLLPITGLSFTITPFMLIRSLDRSISTIPLVFGR
jgi:hypothetical protein